MEVKRIIVPHGAIVELARRFNVSEGTVRAALRYVADTPTQAVIRSAALEEFGGQVTDLTTV